jgi:hypothetical protein
MNAVQPEVVQWVQRVRALCAVVHTVVCLGQRAGCRYSSPRQRSFEISWYSGDVTQAVNVSRSLAAHDRKTSHFPPATTAVSVPASHSRAQIWQGM